MLDVPDEMGKEYQKGDQAPEPDPQLEEHGAMLGKQQARDHAGCEENDAILVLEAYTSAISFSSPRSVSSNRLRDSIRSKNAVHQWAAQDFR